MTTLTKRMAEDLADYLKEMGITHALPAPEIETLERVEILRDLRLGVYDVVVGINLLREGLDLPEVSLVAILDADKEGYLRSGGSLIQTIGRAARHVDGHVIMYADKMTGSMQHAIDETERRRAHPERVQRGARHRRRAGIIKDDPRHHRPRHGRSRRRRGRTATTGVIGDIPKDELTRMVKELEKQMKTAAKNLEFEKAAVLRDQVVELRRLLIE